MKAVVLDEERRLELREVPDPAAEGQTLVEVRAAGVNYADVLIREGRYPQPPPLPFVPGLGDRGRDGGRSARDRLRPRRAAAATRSGPLSRTTGCSTSRTGELRAGRGLPARLPHRVDPADATGAHRARHAVLVTAAAGGVGSAGVQVAAALGAEVVGAVGSREKLEHVRGAGARRGRHVRRIVAGSTPFDVILDQVGGELFAAGLKLLRPLGTIVGIGFAGGAWQPVDPALLVGRNIIGGRLLPRPAYEAPAGRRAGGGAELLGRWAAGASRPVVGATFPLAEADAALRLVADSRSTGKVVLVP